MLVPFRKKQTQPCFAKAPLPLKPRRLRSSSPVIGMSSTYHSLRPSAAPPPGDFAVSEGLSIEELAVSVVATVFCVVLALLLLVPLGTRLRLRKGQRH